jgi:hypothetical protein
MILVKSPRNVYVRSRLNLKQMDFRATGELIRLRLDLGEGSATRVDRVVKLAEITEPDRPVMRKHLYLSSNYHDGQLQSKIGFEEITASASKHTEGDDHHGKEKCIALG